MEPRPHERGNTTATRPTSMPPSSFNGATSSRTWKRSHDPRGARHKRSFNGATSSRTWKLVLLGGPDAEVERLQWSHVLTNVETPRRLSRCFLRPQGFNGATSSRTWKPVRRRSNQPRGSRFNGATSSRTWKPG